MVVASPSSNLEKWVTRILCASVPAQIVKTAFPGDSPRRLAGGDGGLFGEGNMERVYIIAIKSRNTRTGSKSFKP